MSKRPVKKVIAEFFSSEYQRLVGYVRNKVDSVAAMDAEDLVQEVAANLFKRADLSVPIENLSAYVYRSLQNQLTDTYRKRRETVSLDQPLHEDSSQSLIDTVRKTRNQLETQETGDVRMDLYNLLDQLQEEERALIIATEIEGLTFKELSESWEIPVNTLLSKKSRAMKKLTAMTEVKSSSD